MEQMEFEEVDYWEELEEIMDWSDTHVTSTFFICWGAQAAMYHFYGLKKRLLPQKLFGLYRHRVRKRREPLIRGFDDEFYAPHSRHTTVDIEEIRAQRGADHPCRVGRSGSLHRDGGGGKKDFCLRPSGV